MSLPERLARFGRRLRRAGEPRLLSVALRAVAAIGPLRARVHRGAVTALAGADEVLFVCHGNINRSAYAAAVARRDWPGLRIAEAGHDAEAGRASDEPGVAAARSAGVDLSSHQAAAVDAAELAAADVIFVFDARNYLALARRGTTVRRRVRLLAALARSGSLEIADPHGGPTRAYEAAVAAIDRAMEAGGDAARRL